jgi:hypothetical protein
MLAQIVRLGARRSSARIGVAELIETWIAVAQAIEVAIAIGLVLCPIAPDLHAAQTLGSIDPIGLTKIRPLLNRGITSC